MKRPVIITLLAAATLLVLAGIGAVIFFTANDFAGNNPFDRLNISSSLEEEKTLKVDASKPVILTVQDDSGSVSVTGGDVDSVQVKIIKTAYDSTQARADEEVKTIKYSIEQKGNTLTFNYELPKSMNFSNRVNTVDFIVIVPQETTVTIDAGFGKVDVAGTKGNVDIDNDFGDVSVENIEGAVMVNNSSGSIDMTGVKAGGVNIEVESDFGEIVLEKVEANNLKINSSSGRVSLQEVKVKGDLAVKSDFGDVKYENGSAASVNIETNSGSVKLLKLKVGKLIKVDDDFGDIELAQASAASYDLHTNSGTITVDGVKGSLKAYTDFGNIEVLNALAVTLDLKTNSGSVEFSGSLSEADQMVKSDFGNITLQVPVDSKFNVQLKTDFGNIKSDLPITVTLNESSLNEGSEINGAVNGGGGILTVETNSGNININTMK